MRSLFLAFVISILCASNAYAIPVPCKDITKVIDCLINSNEDRKQEPGRWGQVQNIRLSAGKYLVLVEDTYASNSYNPYFWVLLYNKSAKLLTNITPLENSLVRPEVDAANKVITTLNIGRGAGDFGIIQFYKIKNDRLILQKTFSTERSISGTFLDENKNSDVTEGYIKRAFEYTVKMKYNLPLIASLAEGEKV